MSDFISTSHRNAVIIRVDDPELMTRELRARNAAVVAEPSGALVVTGMDSDTVGGLAHSLNVRVFELSNRQATLEEAFLDATGASEEFRASMGLGPTGPMGPTGGPYGPPPPGRGAPTGYPPPPQQGYGPPPAGVRPASATPRLWPAAAGLPTSAWIRPAAGIRSACRTGVRAAPEP